MKDTDKIRLWCKRVIIWTRLHYDKSFFREKNEEVLINYEQSRSTKYSSR